jgi:putative ABC transport system permease protein
MRIDVPLIKFPTLPPSVQGEQDIILNDLRLGTSPTPSAPALTNPADQLIEQPNPSPSADEVIATTTPIAPTPEIVQLTVVGLYETGSPLTDGFFYSNPATARKLAQISDTVASSFIARVDNVEYVETAAEMIRTSLADAEIPVSVSIAKDALGDLNEMLDIFDTFLLAIAVVASVAGGMSIFIIMLMNVNERLKEFGIFKAAGWSNWNIISSVVVEAVTVSLLGSGAGFVAGYSATRLIDMYIGQDIAVITPQLIIGVLSFGIIMGVVGGLYPASNAARVSPMETIRGD